MGTTKGILENLKGSNKEMSRLTVSEEAHMTHAVDCHDQDAMCNTTAVR